MVLIRTWSCYKLLIMKKTAARAATDWLLRDTSFDEGSVTGPGATRTFSPQQCSTRSRAFVTYRQDRGSVRAAVLRDLMVQSTYVGKGFVQTRFQLRKQRSASIPCMCLLLSSIASVLLAMCGRS